MEMDPIQLKPPPILLSVPKALNNQRDGIGNGAVVAVLPSSPCPPPSSPPQAWPLFGALSPAAISAVGVSLSRTSPHQGAAQGLHSEAATEQQGQVQENEIVDSNVLPYCRIDKKAKKKTLGEMEQEFLQALQIMQGPCPNCGTENVSFFGTILTIPSGGSQNNVKCSNCGTELLYDSGARLITLLEPSEA